MEGDLWTLSPRPTCHGMKLRRLQQSRPMANPHPWRLGEDASVPSHTQADLPPPAGCDSAVRTWQGWAEWEPHEKKRQLV
jgi:hypothetical protein